MVPPSSGIQLNRILSRRPHDPVVYFVRFGTAVKIGTTTCLRRRVEGMYLRLEHVLLVVPGGRELEVAYHDLFREYQITAYGRQELFRLEGRLSAFLGAAPLPAPEPDDPEPDPAAPDPLTLTEAVQAGLFAGLKLAGVRTLRNRYGNFPQPVGTRGLAHLYSLEALTGWRNTREVVDASR